ncbi:MAG: AAA family ATPase [Akkermansia sp.]
MADSGKLTSFVLWGPPGCGKTTLARILATRTSILRRALRRLLRHGGSEESL